MRESSGTPVELEKGRQGQFEIVVNGTTVVSRRGGLLARLTGRPGPTEAEVLDAVRAAVGSLGAIAPLPGDGGGG